MSTLASTTCAADGTLRTFAVDASGIAPVGSTTVGKGIGTLAVDATGRRALAGTKEPSGIASLVLGDDDTWQVAGRTATDVTWTYLSRSTDGRFLLGASYGGGVARVWPVAPDESGEGEVLGEATCEVELANPHCIVAVGEHVYVVSLGSDLVAQYRLGDDGVLEPLAEPTLAAPAGSGPRHLAVADGGRTLYLVTEFSGEVVRITRDEATGQLAGHEARSIVDATAGLSHSRFGADPEAEHLVWGADVWRHGRFVVASERCASTLAVLPVGDDGTLGEQVCLVPTEKQPRGFAVTADGLVVCPGEKSDQVSLFRLDDDGQLTPVGRAASGMGGNWVRTTGR